MPISATVTTAAKQYNHDLAPLDEKAREMETVTSRYSVALYRQAFRHLRNSADAEDAVQDAMLSAYKHLGEFRGQARMTTWLTTIVMNAARTQLRKRSRHTHIPIDGQPGDGERSSLAERLADCGPSPEEVYRSRELTWQVRQLSLQLSPAQRRAFELRVLDGLSIREIAHILTVTEPTVKSRLWQARTRLKVLMRARSGGQPGMATRESSNLLPCLTK